MVDLFITIHAESIWNKLHRRQGHCDCSLSKLGIEMSTLLSNRRDLDNIKSIYTSDLKRAYQTAVPLSNRLQIQIKKTSLLREGNWSNYYYDINFPPLPFYGQYENDVLLTDRAVSTLTKIVESEKRIPILIIVHSGFFRCFMKAKFPDKINEYKRRTALNHLGYESGIWYLKKINDEAHLQDSIM